jgi:Uma2 family endonuclease
MLNVKEKELTVYDFLNMDFGDKRAEFIDGEIVLLSAPSTLHQEISVELTTQLASQLKTIGCKLFTAPYNVVLSDSVIQPDLLIVCDKTKLTAKHCVGAPELVIEILSESTWRCDVGKKYALYRDEGCKEYWIIIPEDKLIIVHDFMNSNVLIVKESDVFESPNFKWLKLDMQGLWESVT